MRPVLKATNIQWDVSLEEVYTIFESMTTKEAANYLQLSIDFYKKMSEQDREDYIEDAYHHNRVSSDDMISYLNVDTEITLPNNIPWDEDMISEYISNESGYFHNGFEIECNMSIEDMQKELTIVNNEEDKKLLENAIELIQTN